MQAELTTDVLKTGVVRCCVGQCSNAIPADTALTLRKLPITYVRGPSSCVPAAGRGRGRCGANARDPRGGCQALLCQATVRAQRARPGRAGRGRAPGRAQRGVPVEVAAALRVSPW